MIVPSMAKMFTKPHNLGLSIKVQFGDQNAALGFVNHCTHT